MGVFDDMKEGLNKAAGGAERATGGMAPKPKAEAASAPADAAAREQAAAAKKAEVAAAVAAKQEQQEKTYTVVEGDTLSGIGEQFGVSYQAIAELNGIENPDLIYPGQVFRIPNA